MILATAVAIHALCLIVESAGRLPGVLLGIPMGLLVYVALLPVGTRRIARGRRMRAIPAADLLDKDKRAPVLFLRSFDDDDLIDPNPRMVPLGDRFQRRYEESLSKPFSGVGPVISVGRPGAELARLGGARLFVTDQVWPSAVEYLSERATAIILMVGRTEGIWDEIDSSIQSVPLERLLFFFPYVDKLRRSVWQRIFNYVPARMPLSTKAYRRMEAERQDRYAVFREHTQPLLSSPLPAELGDCQFLDFLPDGVPRLITPVRPWWSRIISLVAPSTAKMSIDLRRTLAPFVGKFFSSPSADNASLLR